MKFLKKWGNAMAPSVHRIPAQAVINRAERKGIHTLGTMAGSILEQMNIVPSYVQEAARSKESLEELRFKLNHAPGIVIANHPGGGDVFAVAKLIDRPDVLVLTSAWAYKNFAIKSPLFDHFLEATKDPQKLRAQFERIKEHITKGGLLVIFPTGGDKEEFLFKSGFKVLIDKVLRPTDMVYSCWVNPEEARSINKTTVSRLSGLAAEGMSGEAANLVRHTTPSVLRVDERYTEAQEWKEAMETVSKKEANQALTEHFLSLWNAPTEPADDKVLEHS